MAIDVVTDLARHFRAMEADIMRAAAGVLNSAAFEARAQIIDASKRTFDRPRDWTTSKAWSFTKAKHQDGARMFAELKAKPEQAKILGYQIDGGIRRKGDPGATRYDVPVGADAPNTDRFGGIARGSLKKIGKAAAKERKDRSNLKARRVALRAQRIAATSDKQRARVGMRLQPLKWSAKSGNTPGTFFGTVGGMRGYWARPERTLAAPTRRKGLQSVRTLGDLKLVLAFADRAKYKKKLKFEVVMQRASRSKMSSANFARELARVQARRSNP
ncbi:MULTISPECIES: hypothetical protein [Agrobacterium]|uniref:hypothetical protein n=1 Tax=Agrobacterium TaxID=357 RepID=UPI0015748B42|nr:MULTISPECIES: hypothetical protein [Agrobacterium]MCD4659439.1 hypothetical protein [Agrobacterium sp.]NTE53817.1 hypothetical protein [Agrobacterium tumefaciens]NTE70554.1 hypothetical protein [Agrobacterium tumefaciens]